jgi:predicted amidohydrolase YtcJ
VQHRTGALWVLNSAALDALSLDSDGDPAERDEHGRLTGRLHRADEWLRDRLPAADLDLGGLGAALAAYGVTGVTDATPFRQMSDLDVLVGAVGDRTLPQQVVAMGGPALTDAAFPAGIAQGPVKLLLDDADLPPLDDVVAHIARAHRHARPVAVHCVTRTSLVLALTAWDDAGTLPGDRIEHGSVIPDEVLPHLAGRGITVVTQPGFVAERGDAYLRDVDPDDVPHLYRCASLLDHGIPVAGSTDAPYTLIDPWAAMRAAVDRSTLAGASLGAAEAVSAQRALELFLGDWGDPGGPPRRVAVGAPADLCLLAVPLRTALDRLSADDVVATWRAGTRIA